MSNLKGFFNKSKELFLWLLLPILVWLFVNIAIEIEPLFLPKPELSSWKETKVLTSTLHVAFPSHLPYGDSDLEVPFAFKMTPPITSTAEISPVLLTVEVDNKPVIFLDDSGDKVSSPLSIPLDGGTVIYNIASPFKEGEYKVCLISNAATPNCISDEIFLEWVFLSVGFRLIKLLGTVITLPVFAGSLLTYIGKIQQELQTGFAERKLGLEKQNQEIAALIRNGDYQSAWDLYQDARSNYLNLLSISRRKAVNKLNPLIHIGSEPFRELVDVWYSKKESLFFRFYDWLTKNFRKSQKGINPLTALSWADYNLDSISHKMIFDKLLDNPKWLKGLVKENGDLDNDLIGWIKENFSQAEWSKLKLALPKNNILEEDLNKICNAVTAPHLYSSSLLLGERQMRELPDKIFRSQSLLVVSQDNRTTIAMELSTELSTMSRGLNKPFPCYTEKLPSSDSDYDFLVWLFHVIALKIIEFLCFNPYYWNESDAQTKMGIATVIKAVYTKEDLYTIFVDDKAKPMLKSLFSYMGKATSMTPEDASKKLELYLFIVSRISMAFYKGVFLILNPLLLDETRINTLVMRSKMLTRYKIFLRLFVDKRSSIELNREGFDDIIYCDDC